MPQIPEDLLQRFMQTTGKSREETEKALSEFISEIITVPISKKQTPKQKSKRSSKPEYDEVNYPHFLPSDEVKKYTIRVALKGTTPTIWRKFDCPSNISLRHLTELVLRLMGWWNEHLNQIVGTHDAYYVPYYQYCRDDSWGNTFFQEEYKLSDLLNVRGKSIKWEYDFGDSWEHEIRLSSIEEYKEDELHEIIFKSGKGACPPEDCGGVWGYQALLDILEKRRSRKRLTSDEKERLEWAGWNKDYDPEYFDKYECIDICDSFTDDESAEEIMDASNGARLISHDLDSMAKEELAKWSPLYDDIISLSFKIRESELWEDLDDSDVFAIRMQDGSEIYIATMGYGGETFDVQLYDGADSFQTYIFMAKSVQVQCPSFELMELHYWADYMSVIFDDPEDGMMRPERYRQIELWAEAHDQKIEGSHGYPFPQIFRPHCVPTRLPSDDTQLARIKEALEAIVWFSQQIMDTDDLTKFGFKTTRVYATEKGGKEVPLVVKTAEGYKVERTKLPGLTDNFTTVTLSEDEITPLRLLQKIGTEFIRLLHFPGYIGNEAEPEKAFLALTLFSVDKNTLMTSNSDLCEISDDYERDVLLQYVNKAKSSGRIPQRIITDDSRTEALLKPLCQQLGIILDRRRNRIPQLSEVCQYMHDAMKQ